MSLAEIIPVVMALPPAEKAELRELLDNQLAASEETPPGFTPESWRTFCAAGSFQYGERLEPTAEGVAMLQQLIEEDRANTR